MTIGVRRTWVRDDRLMRWWNHRLDLAGDIDADLCGHDALDVVIDGKDLGPVATAAILDHANPCDHSHLGLDGTCQACEIRDAVNDFLRSEKQAA